MLLSAEDSSWPKTGGTTGFPPFYSFTQTRYDDENEDQPRGYWLAGLRPGDRVLFCFPLVEGWAGSIVKTPTPIQGILCLDIGAETPLKKFGINANCHPANVLMSTPSFAEGSSEACPKLTGKPVSELGIKKLLLSGEREWPFLRSEKRMEEALAEDGMTT